MRSKISLISAALAALVFVLSPQLRAQEEEKNFFGNFSFGYRAVSTSGAFEKYQEQINLDKGVRLFNFDLTYLATGGLKGLFDRFDLTARNLGGDPYESFGLSIQKYGTYRFKYDHRKSTYFYADQDQFTPGMLFDQNSFNFDRVSDSGAFSLTLTKDLGLFVDFDRFTKSGTNVQGLNLNQIEVATVKPVSEKMTEIGAGLDLHVARYSLVFEQRYQEYTNDNSLSLPGSANGGPDASLPTSYDYFRLSEPYNLKTNRSNIRFTARPFDSLLLRGSAQISGQKSSLSYSEQAAGVSYLNSRFVTDLSGAGNFTRDIQLYDFDLTYFLFERLAVVGAVRSNNFSQSGTFAVEDSPETSDFGFHTLDVECGLQYQFSPRFSLTAGYRNEQRKLTNLATVTDADKTVRNGLFGNLRYDLKNLKLTLDYQHGNFSDPYTPMSPTRYDRFRGTLKFQMEKLSLSGSYLMTRTKNEIPGGINFRIIYSPDNYSDIWKGSNDQFNVRLGYHSDKVTAGVGYSWIQFKSDSDRLIAFNPFFAGGPGTFPWSIHYKGLSTLLDASLDVTPDPSWKLGGYFNASRNSGFWPIDQTTFRGYLAYTFSRGFVTQLSFRSVDFKETASNLAVHNNFSAGIWELSFGYEWK